MSKYILIILVLVFGVGYVFAQGPPDHLAKICITCHQKYSNNTAITKFSPCAKSTCHRSNPTGRWGGAGSSNRYSLHLQKRVCENCHSAKDGKFDVHPIHLKFEDVGINRTSIECKTCHRSPRGYNSSIAYVPPYDRPSIAESTLVNTSIRIPPWGNDCGYCHPSVADAKRLHDVHKPVIDRACKECHGPIMESRLDLVAKITEEPIPEETETKKESLVVREFLLLFDEIARQILKFYKSLRS